MKPGDRIAIAADGTRLARWREEMDAWAQQNVVGQPVSHQLNAAIQARGQMRLQQLGLAAQLTVEDWSSCPADALGTVDGHIQPYCTYTHPEEGHCPIHGCKLTPGVMPHLHVDLLDAWKVQRTRMWPMRPFLPMKRYNEDASVDKTYGALVEGLGPRVFLLQVFEMGAIPREKLESTASIPLERKIPTMTYESVPQMLGDGWLVD